MIELTAANRDAARDALYEVLRWNDDIFGDVNEVWANLLGDGDLAGAPEQLFIDRIRSACDELGVPPHPLAGHAQSKDLSAGGPSACFGPYLIPQTPVYDGWCTIPTGSFPIRFRYNPVWPYGPVFVNDSYSAFLNAAYRWDMGQTAVPGGSWWSFNWATHHATFNCNSFFGINGPNGPHVAYPQTYAACQVAILT